jgi:glycosyltransferase
MRISVITATYNSSATLRDTLESVKAQDHHDVEHIIVDGLSTDGTLNIVSEYAHVATVISEKDKGIYDAMNKGIHAATGDIIGILNSDDFYHGKDVLSRVAAVFKERNCDALYGDLEYVDKVDLNKVTRYWRAGEYQKEAFKWGWMPPHPTFFVKRELYDRFGSFNLGLRTAADYELMLRLIHKEGVNLQYLPAILVKMRTGGASNNSIQSRLKANEDDKKAWAINGLKPFWFTLYLKPIRKISQFIFK